MELNVTPSLASQATGYRINLKELGVNVNSLPLWRHIWLYSFPPLYPLRVVSNNSILQSECVPLKAGLHRRVKEAVGVQKKN